MTASSSLEAARVPAVRAAADPTWGQWKSTTLIPTHGAPLHHYQTRVLTWLRSPTEARYSSLAGVQAQPPLLASRTKPICTTRRRTLGQLDWRPCRRRAPVLLQATRATRCTPSAERMGSRHRMRTRCTISPATPGLLTRQCQQLDKRLVSIPTAAGYMLSGAPSLRLAVRPLPTRCSSPNPHSRESRTARPVGHHDRSLPGEGLLPPP